MGKKTTVTGRINAKAFRLLEEHPDGLRWSELLFKIKASDHNFHPKTVNGCVWKLIQRFPDKVYKPLKGLFRLLKYKPVEVEDSRPGSPREPQQKHQLYWCFCIEQMEVETFLYRFCYSKV